MSTPLSVFLDTCVMPRYPRLLNQAFEQLVDLVKDGVVSVHTSEVVVREWKMQWVDAGKKSAFEVNRESNKLTTALEPVQRQHSDIQKAVTNIAKLLEKSNIDFEAPCDHLLKLLSVNVFDIEASDGQKVMDSYFNGEPPFKAKKNRDDIPDAFIFLALSRLNKTSNVHVICNDSALKNSAEGLAGVFTHSSVSDFLKSGPVSQLIEKTIRARLWTPGKRDEFKKAFMASEGLLTDRIVPLVVNATVGARIEDEEMPDESQLGYVYNVDNVRGIEFCWCEYEERGPGWVIVPFFFDCDVEVEFILRTDNRAELPKWMSVNTAEAATGRQWVAKGRRTMNFDSELRIRFSDVELSQDEFTIPKDIEVPYVELHR